MQPATADNGWVSTLEADQAATIALAHALIASIPYCTLSTCSPDGWPWVSPIFFAYDAAWRIYWSSAIAARHSQNLYHNQGRAVIAIYNSHRSVEGPKGLYLQGCAAEVDPPQVALAMHRLFERAGNQPDRTPQDYLGDSPRRLYCFRPEAVWITGERLAVGQQQVDTKIKLNLKTLLGQSY
ncbi:pyridoxamine 5'-phosphate oxidase family protein [Trichothermofontia sp.]